MATMKKTTQKFMTIDSPLFGTKRLHVTRLTSITYHVAVLDGGASVLVALTPVEVGTGFLASTADAKGQQWTGEPTFGLDEFGACANAVLRMLEDAAPERVKIAVGLDQARETLGEVRAQHDSECAQFGDSWAGAQAQIARLEESVADLRLRLREYDEAALAERHAANGEG